MSKIILTAIVLIFFSLPIYSAIEPIEELSFSIPGLSGDIEQFVFNDINNDNIPEILATDGSILVLYSISLDSILFTDTIPPIIATYTITQNYIILLDDVNRDSLPDILFARYTDNFDTLLSYNEIISCEVTFYDASSNYLNDSTIILYTDTANSHLGYQTSGLSSLEVHDNNQDGYNELIISYESIYELQNWHTIEYVETDGTCKSYYSFPDSLQWESHNYLTNMININDSIYISNNLSNSLGDSHASGSWYITTITPIIMNYDGELINEFDLINNRILPCNNTEGFWHTENSSHLISSQFIVNNSEYNILFQKSFSEGIACFDNGLEQLDTSSSELTLQNYIAPDSLEEIWTLDISGHSYTNFLYHPLEPGYFFAFEYDTLIQFKGSDGSIYQKNDTLPTGARDWVYPFDDNLPRLSISSGNNIKLFKFDISTGINDFNTPNNLPTEFTLAQNYPNPFNPTTEIAYTLPSKGNLILEIFNMLGQKVTTLIDKEQSSGEHKIRWDATSQSSGMYLVKVTFEDNTKSIKTMLLK